MKNTVFFALTLMLLLSACAIRRTDQSGTHRPHSSSSGTHSNKSSSSAAADKKGSVAKSSTKAVFHVIEPLGVQVVLFNMDKKEEETVLMDKTLSQLSIAPGFWQISGFILNGKRYTRMNIGKKFIFEVKKNLSTYVGSYIFQCPKVNQNHLREMKKMNFFNRYPFTTEQRLCELVVGSDYENVNRVWMKLEKRQQEALALGF